MLCQNCAVHPASVFITKVFEGRASQLAYCENCAREAALSDDLLQELAGGDPEVLEALAELPLDELMQSLFDANLEEEVVVGEEPEFTEEDGAFLAELEGMGAFDEDECLPVYSIEKTPRCPQCRTTWDRIRQDGRCGCARCYETFRGEILDVANRLQRGSFHVGKTPRASEKRRRRLEHLRQRRDNQLELLQNRLQTAVSTENYEEAAKLRDRIKIVSSTVVD